MASTISFELFEPSPRNIGEVVQIHNSVFKTKQKVSYYQDILKDAQNPFWVAQDVDDGEILGYIACKIEYPKSKVYIASLAEIPEVTGVTPPLVEKVLIQAKKMGAKEVYTHARKSSKEVRGVLTALGFEESVAGTFRDGETKYELIYPLKGGKPTISKDKGAKRTDIRPLPLPKKDYFKIRTAEDKDINEVLVMHNEFLKKKRERSYFTAKLGSKGVFLVAEDSNGTIIGYIVGRYERKAGLKTGPYQKMNLVSMGVDTEYRGWGIAKKLIKDFIHSVRKTPTIEYIYGHVRGENKAAIKLYKKTGFKLKKEGVYKDDDDIKYQFFMRLRYPSVKPYLKKYQTELTWVLIGMGLHEVYHFIRE